MHIVRISAVGEGGGLVLPAEILRHIGAVPGDVIVLEQTAAGCEIKPCDPDLRDEILAARDVIEDYAPALAELAK